jgi:hypothetical protein
MESGHMDHWVKVVVSLAPFFLLGQVAPIGPAVSQEMPMASGQPSLEAIKKLITDLGQNDFKSRELATKRLREIGLAALDPLYEAAEQSADLELRARAFLVASSIRKDHHLPTRVNGIEFKLIIDPPQLKLKKNENTNVAVSVWIEITNRTNAPQRLCLDEAFVHTIQDAQGKQLVGRLGLPKSGPRKPAPRVLKSNESLTFLVQDCKLVQNADSLSLILIKGSQVLMTYEGLSNGKYLMTVTYSNSVPLNPDGLGLWTGSAATLPVQFFIDADK